MECVNLSSVIFEDTTGWYTGSEEEKWAYDATDSSKTANAMKTDIEGSGYFGSLWDEELYKE